MNKKKKIIYFSLLGLAVCGIAAAATLIPLTQCKKNGGNVENLSYEIINPTSEQKNVLKHGSFLSIKVTQEEVYGDIEWEYTPHDSIVFTIEGENDSELLITNNNESGSIIILTGIVAKDAKGHTLAIENITCKPYSPQEAKAIDGSGWDGYKSGSLYYFIDEDSKEITYVGNNEYAADNLVIPDEVKNEAGDIYKVVCIAKECFYRSELLTGDLSVGNNVRKIYDRAFAVCPNLDGCLYLPASLEHTQTEGTFTGTPFTNIELSPQSTSFQLATNIGGAKGLMNYGADPSLIDYNGPGIRYQFATDVPVMGDYIIPEGVTEITEDAFRYITGITSIAFPESLNTIGDYAFANCWGLSGTLSIPTSVTTIGTGAFCNTNFDDVDLNVNSKFVWANNLGPDAKVLLNASSNGVYNFSIPSEEQVVGGIAFGDIEIPANVTAIVEDAFARLNISSVKFLSTSSLSTIGDGAFAQCLSLSGTLSIPTSVTAIGAGAFNEVNLDEVELNGNPNFKLATNVGEGATILLDSSNGGLYDYEDTSANQVVGGIAFGQLTIPDTGVTKIGDEAFNNLNFLSGTLEIPGNVTEVGQRAFNSCSRIQELILHEGLKTVKSKAFFNLLNVKNDLLLPDTLETVLSNSSEGAFGGIASKNATFGDGLTVIPAGIFASGFAPTLIRNVTLSNNVAEIGENAFKNCTSINNIDFGAASSLTTIGEKAFVDSLICSPFNIPSSLENIGEDAFKSALFSNIDVGDNLHFSLAENVGEGATFLLSDSATDYDYSKSSDDQVAGGICYGNVTIPSGVTEIAGWEFQGKDSDDFDRICGNLILPETVETIDDEAFYGGNFNEFVIPDSVTTIGGGYAFNNFYAKELTCNGKGKYKLANNVGGAKILLDNTEEFNYSKSSDEQVAGGLAFGNLSIQGTITTIGDNAFKDLPLLSEDLIIPASVTSIGAYAFSGIHQITSIEFLGSVDITLGSGCFNMTKIHSISFNFDEQPNNISGDAFYGCGSSFQNNTVYINNNGIYPAQSLLTLLQDDPGLGPQWKALP